jgi:hypothetical protein
VEGFGMTEHSLTATILRYKAENYASVAGSIEADERGGKFEDPGTVWPIIEKIEAWNTPATDQQEAILALELAIEDYEIGDTARIPAMMKAALGWMKASAKESHADQDEACTSGPQPKDTIDDIQTATGCLHALLVSVYETSTEIQFRLPDGRRDDSAERLSALIILARDEAQRIDQRVEAYIDDMMGGSR